MSLLGRLVVLVLIAVTPGVVLQVWNEVRLRTAREAEVHADVLRQARALAEEHEMLLKGMHQLLRTLGHLPVVQTHDRDRCSAVFAGIMSGNADLSNISAATPQGDLFCSAAGDLDGPGKAPTSVADRSYFREALARTGFVVGELVVSRLVHIHVLPVAMPFRAPDGTIGGVVTASLNLDALAKRLDRRGWSHDLAFLIGDRNGTTLVRQPDHRQLIGKPFPDTLQSLLGKTEPGVVETVGIDGVARIIGYVPPAANPTGLYYGVGMTRPAAFAALNEITGRHILIIALGTILTIVLAMLGGRAAIIRPVSQLCQTAARYAAGDWTAQVPEDRYGGEIGRLIQATDRMAEATRSALAQKDMLLREVHHRVMNSFSMLASLVLLQVRGVSDPAGRAALNETGSRIQALALVYRRLHVAGTVNTVEMSGYLRGLCAEIEQSLLGIGDPRAIVVEADQAALPTVQAIPLGLIVNELVTNALKYAFLDGRAGTVRVVFTRQERGWCMIVEDDGIGLPQGFRPEGTAGLGMQVIMMLTGQLNGTLTIDREHRGARLSLMVPF